MNQRPRVTACSAPLVAELVERAATLRVGVDTTADGARIVDAGIDCPGSIEAVDFVASARCFEDVFELGLAALTRSRAC